MKNYESELNSLLIAPVSETNIIKVKFSGIEFTQWIDLNLESITAIESFLKVVKKQLKGKV